MSTSGPAGALIVTAGSAGTAAGLLWCRSATNRWRVKLPVAGPAVVVVVVGTGWALLCGVPVVTSAAAVTGLVTVGAVVQRSLPALSAVAGWWLVASCQFRAVVPLWWLAVVMTTPMSPAIRAALVVVALPMVVRLPCRTLDSYLDLEVLGRERWAHARHIDCHRARVRGPKVSVHVPCYAEPPDLVIRTLDALARQDYTPFEVLVVDNNTDDERLWRPVEHHCRRLGGPFRFIHVTGLSGAKAGALNLALRHTSDDAELIAVVDSDYEAEPTFLSSLVGYFDDPDIAFVQTRHDYRDWEDNPYLRSCYWEYQLIHRTYLVSRNEWDTAMVCGTMCLFRRSALTSVGGWAEWCPSEDSEVVIRLYAAGFNGHSFDATTGRGIVPDTFETYRRQRHRWIRGPVLELRRHWRLYLPRRWAIPSALTRRQKVLLANHGLRSLNPCLDIASSWTIVASLLLAGLTGTTVSIPGTVLVSIMVVVAASSVVDWCVQRHAVGCSWRDAAAALTARASLTHVSFSAGLHGLTNRRRRWERTTKFPATASRWAALRSVRVEIAHGTTLLAVCAGYLAFGRATAVLGLALVELVPRGLALLTAPVQALRANRHLPR